MRPQNRFSYVLYAAVLLVTIATILTSGCSTRNPQTRSALSIDVDATLDKFKENVRGGATFLQSSEGVLVFPNVVKAGIALGGEYGEGILRVNGRNVDFYSTAGASIGFQFGAQRKSLVLVFLDKYALDKFRRSDGWRVGIDGSVAVAEWGMGEDINNIEMESPVIAFIFDNEGLMYNLTLEGAKFTRLR